MSRKYTNLITAVIILLQGVWWLVPSNLAYLISQNRDIFLGRYSEGRFYAMFFVLLLTFPLLHVIRADPARRRERWFMLIAASLGFAAGFVLLDTTVRLVRNPRYEKTRNVYHRPPGQTYSGVFEDLPEKGQSYANLKPGHAPVPYTLTTDRRGFRNRTELDRYEVVVAGDSFVEGSKVSDDQVWTELFAGKSGRSVYNLGVSGSGPSSYVQSMKLFGAPLQPEVVICSIYEGNDFRGSGELVDRLGEKSSLSQQVEVYFKYSPVRMAIDDFITRYLTMENVPGPLSLFAPAPPVFAGTPPREGESLGPLAWLPVRVPDSATGHYYTFTVKRLLCHYQCREDFATSPGCRTVKLAIAELKAICRELGAELVIFYVPDKARVIMPFVEKRLPPEQLRSFLALKMADLPDPALTRTTLYANLDVREREIADFCQAESVRFVSATGALRRAVAAGGQPYYTYDQHWTPAGHELAAEVMAQALAR